jgi:putative ABC transport system ATP-binding protein
MTLIMVTHELSFARFCKRTLVVRDGYLVNDQLTLERLRATEQLKLVLESEAEAQLTARA